MATFDNNRNYGIEIEFSWEGRCPSYDFIAQAITNAGVPCSSTANYNSSIHNVLPTWKIVPDGSVTNGGELVSPILHGLDGKEQLRIVLRTIKELGAKTHTSAGIHVHHCAADMTAKNLANIAELYKSHESIIDQFVAVSRRRESNPQYCGTMHTSRDYWVASNPFSQVGINSSDDHKRNMIQSMSPGRYRNVNLNAYLAHGTVEFRQHQSSLNVNKIWSWIVFTQTVMTVAKSHRGKITGRTVNTGPAHTRQLRSLLREMGMRKANQYDDVTLDAYKRLMKRLPREMRVNYRNGDPVNDNRDGMEAVATATA